MACLLGHQELMSYDLELERYAGGEDLCIYSSEQLTAINLLLNISQQRTHP